MKRIFESDRAFALVALSGGGHGRLILTSNKTPVNGTRLSCIFKTAWALDIRCWIEGIRIEEADRDYLKKFPSNPAAIFEPGMKVFRISSRAGWEGYVLAMSLHISEDEDAFAAEIRSMWPPEEQT